MLTRILCILLLLMNKALFCVANQPDLIRVFFKRFTEQLGSCPRWSFTTPSIITDWGECYMTDDEIIVTIGEQTVHWAVPGGPWTIQYTTSTGIVDLVPQQNSIATIALSKRSYAEAFYNRKDHSGTYEIIEWIKNECIKMMGGNVVQPKQEEIVNSVLRYISWHWRTFSEQDIENLLYDVQLVITRERVNEQEVFQKLNKSIEEKIQYYKKRIENPHDYKECIKDYVFCFGTILTSIALTGITYSIYKKWHKGSNTVFKEIVKDLSELGVSIQERYVNYGKNIVNYIDVVAPSTLSQEQIEYTRTCQKQLVSLYNTKENAVKAEIVGGVVSVFSWLFTAGAIKEFLFPEHKKHCATLLLIQQKFIDVLQN